MVGVPRGVEERVSVRARTHARPGQAVFARKRRRRAHARTDGVEPYAIFHRGLASSSNSSSSSKKNHNTSAIVVNPGAITSQTPLAMSNATSPAAAAATSSTAATTTTATANGIGAPPPPPSLLDPDLIPSILPRISAIVDTLREVASAESGAASRGEKKVAETTATAGAVGPSSTTNTQPSSSSALDGLDVEMAFGGNDNAKTAERLNVPPSSSSYGPSIALGAMSDDTQDHALYEFLHSSDRDGAESSSSSAIPPALTAALVRQSKELRKVYADAERAVNAWEEGEWAASGSDEGQDEVKETIAWLEQRREDLL